jgi:homoserine dehydrogenase
VVSANKALLADDGVELHARGREAGVDLYYEAAVAGAIPLLRPLRESLAGDQLRRVVGIVNGTTNYILSRMAETGPASPRPWRGHRPRLRRGRPDRRRRRLRRRAKAAILASLPSTPPVVAPTSTARASPRSPPPTSPAPRRSAASVKLLASRRRDGGAGSVRGPPRR